MFMSYIMRRFSGTMIELQRMRVLRNQSLPVVVGLGTRSDAVWQLRIPG